MFNSQISFGRTVKFNAPIKYGDKLQDMVKNPQKYPKATEVTDKLKETFPDAVDNGKAMAYSNGLHSSYILTGKEYDEAKTIHNAHMNGIESAQAYFNSGDDLDMELIRLADNYSMQMKSLIERTKSNTQIYLTGTTPDYKQDITSIRVDA